MRKVIKDMRAQESHCRITRIVKEMVVVISLKEVIAEMDGG